MSKKIRWITETAVMLALLVCLQWVGSFVPDQMTKQLITGTMVNCVLAVTVLMVGFSSGRQILVNFCTLFAPSMSAASYSSLEMDFRPAM